ncbi:diguanylate phosphodiesterase [Kluyvera ascorbata]|uniref:diguanylate phosphodiesterase n=1 Tax=Kluyvera ascorbata TaxID=51288 RepID=UPI0020556E84|nr:diguanylate phosphodiesterase [Kluyvera ascorbata]UPQ69741.1 diguanylate phosphodiesterase [Kluyvera ascorbata]
MLTTLIYRSRLCDTVPFRDVETMVAAANVRNEHESITGILLFNGLHFFQLLEGPENTVKMIYQQICKDVRHYNVVELMCDYAPARRFGKAGMELFDLRKHGQDDVLQAVLDKGTSRYQLTYSDRALQFVRTFVLTDGKDGVYEIPPADSWDFIADAQDDNAAPSDATEEICFQPLIDPLSREIVSLEARTRGPAPTSSAPDSSSDDMYQTDLMAKKAAFATGAKLLAGSGVLSVSLMPMTLVNVPGAVDFLLTEIAANGLVPEQIEVQFTENEVISRFDEFAGAVKGLKASGISVAIDHFGAGFAGLQLLARFQPDRIKISQDLITEVHKSGPRQAIIHAIIKCCSSLEIRLSADGIMLAEEWMWLESAGIEHFQGALFSSPDCNRIPSIAWPEKKV